MGPEQDEKVLLFMFCNAVPGRDNEFNDWYTNVHLAEVVELAGFAAAQRFELVADAAMTADAPDTPYRYLTLYEVPAGELERVDAALYKRARTDRDQAIAEGRRPPLTVSETLDRDMRTWFFRSISPRLEHQ